MQPATLLLASAALLGAASTASAFEYGSNNRVMWESDCDFYGQDRYAVEAGADRCGDLCADDTGCTHWTWTDHNGGTCWLKSGGAMTKSTFWGAGCGYVVGRAADPSAATRSSSSANGLSKDDTDYMLYLINDYRRQYGVAPLALNARLTAAAAGHSQEQADACHMTHASADGSDFSHRISNQGYEWSSVRENVAAGQSSVADVMSSWMNSDHHRANILDPTIEEVGFAKAANAYCNNYQIYWTQDFGTAA